MAYVNFAEGEDRAFPCRNRRELGSDPRLDALSRASIAAWHGNGALSSSEAQAFVAAGFRADQLAELLASVGSSAATPNTGVRA